MRDHWLILLKYYSYLPLPKRNYTARELPQALYLLPLWGLGVGILLWLAAFLMQPLYYTWQAAFLLALMLLFNGGVWLRDLMAVADGRLPLTMPKKPGEDMDKLSADDVQPVYIFSRKAWFIVGIYVLLQYCVLWLILRGGFSLAVLLTLALVERWFYLWGINHFVARRPALLKLGLSKADFAKGSILSAVGVGISTYFAPILWLALAAAFFAAWLFYRSRSNYLGALDECSYGAASAWGGLILLWVYFGFMRVI